ncbi:MAG: single-stranded DNA-binding protein [Ghiorsea sp.]
MSLAALKKNRMSFGDLQNKITKESSGGNAHKDDRLYYPKLDENKNGSAILRFLPAPEGEDSPWVKVYSHGFKGDNGRWYIEECPTTIGGECVLCSNNSVLWNSGIESNKDIVRKRKRKMQYVANVLVVEDKKNPENEGAVKLFKFGAKIFDKIKGALNPEFDDMTPKNPFDPWEGCNFRLRIRKFEGNVNYDLSEFDSVSKLAKTDAAIEKIWKAEHSLNEMLSEDKFETEEVLTKKLNLVIGSPAAVAIAPSETPKPSKPATPVAAEDDEKYDSAMDFYRKMAEDD